MAMKKKRGARPIIGGHLERVNSRVFDRHQKQITGLVRRNQGLYALYKRHRLYYVGLASNLRGRIKHHLRDKHKGKWDHFSLYIIRKEEHIRELESLLLRISRPTGNKQHGKLGRSKNLLPELKRQVREEVKREFEILFKHDEDEKQNISTKRKKTYSIKGERPLKGLFPTGKSIYAKYKGNIYKARVNGIGRIKYQGIWYNSPSMAGQAILDRGAVNGWNFWKYKDKSGKLNKIANLRK